MSCYTWTETFSDQLATIEYSMQFTHNDFTAEPLMPTVNYYYYYYTSLKASFSRTTWVSRYQKGKTSLHINEARFWYGSGIRWTVCKQCAPRFRQITTSTPHQSSLNFYRPHALPDAQTTVSEQ